MKPDNAIRILLVEDAQGRAEKTISVLRNHGIRVHPTRAASRQQLAQECGAHAFDIALVNPHTHGVGVADVVAHQRADGFDFAVVALLDEVSDQVIGELFQQGVHVFALRSNPEQLAEAVRSAFDVLSTHRSVEALTTALRDSERRCDALLASSRDPIAYVHDGVFVRANHAYLDVFGYAGFDEIQGLTLLDMVSADNAAELKRVLKGLAKGDRPESTVAVTAMRHDGTSFAASVEFSQARFEGEACLQVVFRPRLPVTGDDGPLLLDPATGLLLRARMLELIAAAAEAAGQGQRAQALLLMRPDHWKSVVGAIGLVNTDSLMEAIATRINGCLDARASAGRMDDRTVVILLRDHDDDQVRECIDRLLTVASEGVYDIGAYSLTLTFGIGATLLGERNADAGVLLEQAGAALREAQDRGTGTSRVHDPGAVDKAAADRERECLERLHDALRHDRFTLYRQQIISLKGDAGDFFEVLMHLDDADGAGSATDFLVVARDNGLMPALDRWALDHAVTLLASAAEAGQSLRLFAKLDAESMLDQELATWLVARCTAAGIEAGSLVLEIPERHVLTSLKPVQGLLQQLRPLGLDFALGQFAAESASFQLLKHVDVDYLKLDRKLLLGLPERDDRRTLITEACRQAAALDKAVMVEGVEDATTTSILFACGVDFVQGDFLRRAEKARVPNRHAN